MSAFFGSLDGAVAVQGGAIAILGAVIYAILRGLLVPRATLDRIVRGYEERAAAAEVREAQWREVAMTASRQTDRLLVTARVAEATLAALPTDAASSAEAGP